MRSSGSEFKRAVEDDLHGKLVLIVEAGFISIRSKFQRKLVLDFLEMSFFFN